MSAVELVQIHPDPLERISALCSTHPSREVGGVLFGFVQPGYPVLHADHACGPGPAAEMERRRLLWDPSYVVGYIDAITARGFTAPIGRWHKHCTPDLRASAEDRVGAAAFRAALGLNALVDVIVATVHDEPIGWAAYLCTAAGYERITAELPDGVRG